MEIGRETFRLERRRRKGLPISIVFINGTLDPELDKCLAPTVPLQQLLPLRYQQMEL